MFQLLMRFSYVDTRTFPSSRSASVPPFAAILPVKAGFAHIRELCSAHGPKLLLAVLVACTAICLPVQGQQTEAEKRPAAEKPAELADKPDGSLTEPPGLAEPEAAKSVALEAKAEKPDNRAELPREVAAVLDKKSPECLDDLRAIEQQVGRVLAVAMPATVGLQIGSSAGSGVIISEDGLILTAGHVSGMPHRDVWVILSDGRRVRGKTLGINRGIDSGLIKITEEGKWPYVEMAKAGEIKPGQWVVAVGHPGGFRPNRTAPVRLGRVMFHNDHVVCSDCTLVGGDSGGPLFNMRGEVVAIHSRIGPNIKNNFHVPISTYHATWNRLVTGKAWGGPPPKEQHTQVQPFLGVHLDGREEQPLIAQVNPGAPAQRAGIQKGDVILSFDGHLVANRASLINRILDKRPGDKVAIEISRDGKAVKVKVRLVARSVSLPGSPKEKDDDAPPPPKNGPPKPTPQAQPDKRNDGAPPEPRD